MTLKIFKKLIASAALMCWTASCVDDLNVKPLNDYDFTSEVAYSTPESYKQGLAKIYSGMNIVGQDDPGGSEIAIKDAGNSELVRQYWSLQEMTTDEAFCAWGNDSWVREINFDTWTSAPNDGISAVYYRTILIATLANEYLNQTAAAKLDERGVSDDLRAKIQTYRAEARFVRAYVYWIAMDFFANPPFVTEKSPIGKVYPKQTTRTELFTYIESELKDIADGTSGEVLMAPKSNEYGRVDKCAAWGLLSRMYLNAEVYIGTKHYNDAMTYSAKVMDNYSLCSNYAYLFMLDNNTNPEALKEIIYPVVYDANVSRSYGGTTFLMNASYNSDNSAFDGEALEASGLKEGWAGIRTSYDFIEKYFGVTNANFTDGTYTLPDNDKRFLFSIKGREKNFSDNIFVFKEGVGVTKFKNIKSDGTLGEKTTFASLDFPMMRAGEMYLIYAEAQLRSGITGGKGYECFKAIRDRAGLTTDQSLYNLQEIFNERSRELYWEGYRRTDLIRFDYFNSATFLWPFKGGVKEGTLLDQKYKIFPLVQTDVDANPNLKQNTGY